MLLVFKFTLNEIENDLKNEGNILLVRFCAAILYSKAESPFTKFFYLLDIFLHFLHPSSPKQY